MWKALIAVLFILLLLGAAYLYFSLQAIQVEVESVKFVGVSRSGMGFSFLNPKIKVGLRVSNPTFLTATFTLSNAKVYIEGDLVAVQNGEAKATIKANGESIVYVTLTITDVNALSKHLIEAWIFGQEKTLTIKSDVTPSLIPITIPVETSKKL